MKYSKDIVLLIAFPNTRSFKVPTVFGLQGSPHTIGPTKCTDVAQSWLDISRQATATSYRHIANKVRKCLCDKLRPIGSSVY